MREYGYLFLLIASSETRARRIMSGCQEALRSEDRALLAHRYSTRDETAPYEVPLSPAEFSARQEFGCFLLDWEHNQLQFGLGVELDRWLDGGLNVVALGHSQVLEPARRRYGPHLRVVYAPGGKDPRRWLDRVLSGRTVRFRQLGLGFNDGHNFTGPIDGLQLDEDYSVAIQQLTGWVQKDDPPALAA